jgi:hypothetical protein
VSRKMRELLANVVNLGSGTRLFWMDEEREKVPDLKGDVPEEETESKLLLSLYDDRLSPFEADYATLPLRLLLRF